MPKPLVSVIIPCFGAAATLPVAVRSVLTQDFTDFEIIIVDDGSKDASLAVARALAAEDSRVRVIAQQNAGPAAARNRGIVEARGRYIGFLDADDRWAHTHLRTHVAHFSAHPDCGVSFARIAFFDPELTLGGRLSAHMPQLRLADILGENPICTTSNIVARGELFAEIGGFDPALTHGEDQEWVARVLAKTRWRVCGLNKVLVDYRTSPGGLSADLARTHAGWLSMLRRVHAYAPDAAMRAAPAASALFHRYLARRALRTGQPRAALRPMLRALRSSPLTLLTHQPHRTAMTLAGALAALVPGNPLRATLAR
jgi:cellulose synthase/poly-beta-1,6-N-acetylglucosamine synthase-like glycosyltransferase